MPAKPKPPVPERGATGKKDSGGPSTPIDETDLLWEEDVTPVAGTATLELLGEEAPTKPRAQETIEEHGDPCPSPFERVTVAPPLPEREYVARMMGNAQEADPPRVPRHRPGPHAMTPPPPTVKAPTRQFPSPALEQPDLPPSGFLRKETLPGFALHPSDSTPPSSRSMRAAAPGSGSRPPVEPDALVLDLTESIPPGAARPSPAGNQAPARAAPPSSQKLATVPSSQKLVTAPSSQKLAFGGSQGNALDLVGARAQSKPPRPPVVDLQQVRDRFDAGDFSGALIVAEGILSEDPDNADALGYAEHCRDVLKNMYLSRLGGLTRVPMVAVSSDQLRWLSLDHRAGFLLSLVDGRSNFDEILDMCGMSDLEALRLLVQLLQQGVIKMT
jgi:hypothetical protein